LIRWGVLKKPSLTQTELEMMMLELLVLDDHCLHRIDVALAFGLRMPLRVVSRSFCIGFGWMTQHSSQMLRRK